MSFLIWRWKMFFAHFASYLWISSTCECSNPGTLISDHLYLQTLQKPLKSTIFSSYWGSFILKHLLIDVNPFKNQKSWRFFILTFRNIQPRSTRWNFSVQPLAYLSLRCSGSDISDCLPRPQVELQHKPGARYSPFRSSCEAAAMQIGSRICMMDNGKCGKFPCHLLSSRIMRIPEGVSVTPTSIWLPNICYVTLARHLGI